MEEVERLRKALREQWETNHFEQCGREWPHPVGKTCMWPLPVELEETDV